MGQQSNNYDLLKKISLFADLPEDVLNQLCMGVEEVRLGGGEVLFHEGSLGDRAYVIQDGQLEILKSMGEREVLLDVRGTGDVIGEMALLQDAPRMASVRARDETILLAISQDQFERLLMISATVARSMLRTITTRWRTTEAKLQQNERMTQLGTFTAGMAHELNNPTASVQSGASQLWTTIREMQQLHFCLEDFHLAPAQLALMRSIDQALQDRAGEPAAMDALTRGDREYELEEWLDDHDIENVWEIAPTLIGMGYDTVSLGKFLENFDSAHHTTVLRWIHETGAVYSLLRQIRSASGRVSDIVNTLKTYVFLDQAPVQAVDVREGLDSTVALLQSRIAKDVVINREYADVPRIDAYGSELNQVWTHLIDNALYALDGRGTITLRAAPSTDGVVVEVEDDGPGIPAELQSKVFGPFFTTRPPGHGAGMGLNFCYNTVVQKQRGAISFESRPGRTIFRIALPRSFDSVGRSVGPILHNEHIDDAQVRGILTSVKTIAVVGASSNPERSGHTVPLYLQEQGYTIIPVNPNAPELFDVKSYPDLAAIPQLVDEVLIFRAPEVVLPIVEQAIAIGARVVWMQEGIVNKAAADVAIKAGLVVVMNICMRQQRERLTHDFHAGNL